MEGINDFEFDAIDQIDQTSSNVGQTDTTFINEFTETVTEPAPDAEPTEPASDTPPVDTTINDSNPTEEPPAPTGNDAIDAINKEEYERVLAEKQALEEQIKSLSQEELNDNSKKILEYIRENKLSELKEFLDIQTKDFGAMPKESLVADYLKETNPDWTEEDINDVLSQKYGLGIDEDLMTEQEKRAYTRDLNAKAKEALKYFEGKKSEIQLPDLSPKQAVDTVDAAEVARLQEEALMEWESSVSESLKDFNKLSVDVKEGEQFDFALNEEATKELIQDMKTLGKDVSVFFKPYINEGKINARKLAEDMSFLKNKEAIIKVAVAQQVAKAQEDWLKGIKNTSIGTQDRSVTPESRDILESFVDLI